MRRFVMMFAAAAVLVACSEGESGQASTVPAAPAPAPVKADVPAGEYTLDKGHGSLIFRVDHLGMSRYTARFTRWDAKLQLDPANPANSSVTATIDPRSLETHYPDPKLDFNAQLQSADWLHTARFPEINFRSTRIQPTGPDTARITGELSLHGVTRPVVLEAKYNGGYAGHAMDPAGSHIGFSAYGTVKRSEFGVSFGVPAPGSTLGVGDQVEVMIEAEFTRLRQGGQPSLPSSSG